MNIKKLSLLIVLSLTLLACQQQQIDLADVEKSSDSVEYSQEVKFNK